MPDQGGTPASVVLAVHEHGIVDSGDMGGQVMMGIEKAGAAVHPQRAGKPDTVEHIDEMGTHRPREGPHDIGAAQRLLFQGPCAGSPGLRSASVA